MQKSLLEIYIAKVAAGEKSFVDKLCAQLTDRLCYIPAIQVDSESNHTRIQVARIERHGQSFVPLFTHERTFKTWAAGHSEKVEPVSLLGGDLCAVLGLGRGVILDPGSDPSAELAPEAVSKIAVEVLASEREDSFFAEELPPESASLSQAAPECPVEDTEITSSEAQAGGLTEDVPDNSRDFEANMPTIAVGEASSAGIHAYEDLISELGSAKTQVVSNPLEATQAAMNITPHTKRGILSFLKKVVRGG